MMETGSMARSKVVSLHDRMVKALVVWLTPRRLRIYPAALILSSLMLNLWLSLLAVRSGAPFWLTLGQDFKAYYTGGRLFLDGRLTDLYNFDAQRDLQKDLAVPGDGLLPFVYPPFTVLLSAAFAVGGYVSGLWLWWACGLGVLALAVYGLGRALALPRADSPGRILFVMFFFLTGLTWFLYGQNTPLSLLLYTLTFILLRRGQDAAGGFALGVLLYKPQLAIPLGAALVVKQRWRALLGVALGAGLWLVIGLALSPAAMLQYLRISPQMLSFLLDTQSPDSRAWAVHTFYAFAALWLGNLWPKGAAVLGTALAVGGALTIVVMWHRADWGPGTRAWDLRFAATVALGLLIVPYVFVYDLMLLLLPLAIAWSHYPHGAGDRPLDGGTLLAWTILLFGAIFASGHLAAAQLSVCDLLGLPRMAVQLSVPVIAGWAWALSRLAHGAAGASQAQQVGHAA